MCSRLCLIEWKWELKWVSCEEWFFVIVKKDLNEEYLHINWLLYRL